ncbi:MAG: helix-turn-helix domain-containing protein [Victivallales bacterium]|nr:helix-turn-helix domain-containing protein [Victivallales bacterium]
MRYLTVAEAERYCKMCRKTLWRLVKSGKLKSIKLSPARSGKVFFDLQDIDDFMSSMKEVQS